MSEADISAASIFNVHISYHSTAALKSGFIMYNPLSNTSYIFSSYIYFISLSQFYDFLLADFLQNKMLR